MKNIRKEKLLEDDDETKPKILEKSNYKKNICKNKLSFKLCTKTDEISLVFH